MPDPNCTKSTPLSCASAGGSASSLGGGCLYGVQRLVRQRPGGAADPQGSGDARRLDRRYPITRGVFAPRSDRPHAGLEVAAEWGVGAILLLYQWIQQSRRHMDRGDARAAYDWLSEKTRAATQLFWWNSLLLPKSGADKQSGLRADLLASSWPNRCGRAIEAYEASPARQDYTYYYRMARRPVTLDLQYCSSMLQRLGGRLQRLQRPRGRLEGFHVFFKLARATALSTAGLRLLPGAQLAPHQAVGTIPTWKRSEPTRLSTGGWLACQCTPGAAVSPDGALQSDCDPWSGHRRGPHGARGKRLQVGEARRVERRTRACRRAHRVRR